MKNDKKTKSWFVIIIGDNERPGPFEVTRRALIISSIFLVVVIAGIAAGSSWLYGRPYVTSNNELIDELATARQSIELLNQEKEDFSEEIERLQAKFETSPTKRENQAATVKVTRVVKTEPFVSLEEMKVTHNKDNKTLKIRFIIRSQSADEDYISGYVFIILNPVSGSSAPRKVSPAAELVGGLPQSYKKGENFYIARFKYIEGVFSSISDKSEYKSFSILVYANDGTLRLKKEIPL